MRIIKFRGLKTDRSGWVYGDLNQNDIHHGVSIKEYGVINNAVIPETAGQFTGLKDKNDKDIYEGDKLSPEEDETENIVRWHDELAMFVIDIYGYDYHIGEGSQEVYDSDPSLCYTSNLSDYAWIEVIGNIHEK